MSAPRKYAIIVAAGSGRRAGSPLPKQFHPLGGRTVFMHSVIRFLDDAPEVTVIVVCHPDFIQLVEKEMDGLGAAEWLVVPGGNSRPESVRNGLNAIRTRLGTGKSALIAVHDAARPLVSALMIREGWHAAEEYLAAVPAVPVTDSLRQLSDEGRSEAVDRSRFVAVQTPQVFRADILLRAYDRPKGDLSLFTDDASLVEASGVPVALYPGSPENIKITHPRDFAIAEAILHEAEK